LVKHEEQTVLDLTITIIVIKSLDLLAEVILDQIQGFQPVAQHPNVARTSSTGAPSKSLTSACSEIDVFAAGNVSAGSSADG
jgi:hypothetical protein